MTQDRAEAVSWLERAAAQGLAPEMPSPAPAAAGKRKSVAAAPRLELATPLPAQ